MPRIAKRVGAKFQFRVVWKYKGQSHSHEYRSDKSRPVLNRLRMVGTDQPWLGMGRGRVRRIWAHLCLKLMVPFDAIAGLTAKEATQRLQDTYPPLEWIRVEHRQVGPWTETLDPLESLRTPTTEKMDAGVVKLFEEIDAMPQEALDAWRRRITPDWEINSRKSLWKRGKPEGA